MMDKELIESLNLSNRYIRAYGENAVYESAFAFQTMFEKKASQPEVIEDKPGHQEPSYTGSQEIQQIYAVRDVWYALFIATSITMGIMSSGVFLAIVLMMTLKTPLLLALIIVLASGIYGLSAGWKTWKVHQPGVVIDLSEGTLSFAAEDIENTFWEIITLKQFFNHWQRISIPLNEILRIDNDTLKLGKGKNTVKHYGLNISGTFGSQQIVFTKKQKRDECRALLAHVFKKILNGNIKFDFNVNTGLSNDGQ